MLKIIRTFSCSTTRRSTDLALRMAGYLNKLSEKASLVEGHNSMSAEDINLISRYRMVEPNFRSLQDSLRDFDELNKIAEDPQQDSEFREIAKADIEAIVPRISELVDNITAKILVTDDFDGNSASLEVIPGAGGMEASMFAEEIFDFYCNYNLSLGHDVEVTELVKAAGGDAVNDFLITEV